MRKRFQRGLWSGISWFVSTFVSTRRPGLFPPYLFPGPDEVQTEGALLLPEMAVRPEVGVADAALVDAQGLDDPDRRLAVAVGIGDAYPPCRLRIGGCAYVPIAQIATPLPVSCKGESRKRAKARGFPVGGRSCLGGLERAVQPDFGEADGHGQMSMAAV